MASWWLDRVLPELVGGGIITVAAYVKLYFEHRWPFWGRRGDNGH